MSASATVQVGAIAHKNTRNRALICCVLRTAHGLWPRKTKFYLADRACVSPRLGVVVWLICCVGIGYFFSRVFDDNV